jgi:hypothetical protein
MVMKMLLLLLPKLSPLTVGVTRCAALPKFFGEALRDTVAASLCDGGYDSGKEGGNKCRSQRKIHISITEKKMPEKNKRKT